MSDSTPNQVEADSIGSTIAGPTCAANDNPVTAGMPQVMHATALTEALSNTTSRPHKQYLGTESISRFSNPTEELTSLLNTVGVYDLGWRRMMRCTGEDRVRWLNGMVTNFVGNLIEDAGCYAFILNAQGRIQGDIDIYRRADSFWLETDAAQVETLMAFLDRYIIMDDVALELQPEWTAIGVAGPDAVASITEAGLPVPSSPLQLSQANWQGHTVVVTAAYSPLVSRYEIWMKSKIVADLWSALVRTGAVTCGVESLETLRVLEGTPLYSVDITAKDLPQETNQMRALHFNKGCYLGQEIVERIHSRGNVHRTFTGFVLANSIPTPGTSLLADGKVIGEITSVASVMVPGIAERVLALGSIRREALEQKTNLTAGETVARPSPLPFDIGSKPGTPQETVQ